MNLFKRKEKTPPIEKTEEEKQKDAERKAIKVKSLLSKIEKIILELSAVLAIVIAWVFTKNGAILGIVGLISIIRMVREDKNWMAYLINKMLGIIETDSKNKQAGNEIDEKKE